MQLADRIASQAHGRGPGKHHSNPAAPSGPLTSFGRQLRLAGLFRREHILDLFGRRVSWSAIKHWRKGRRRAPQWAMDTLALELEKIVFAINNEKEKAPD